MPDFRKVFDALLCHLFPTDPYCETCPYNGEVECKRMLRFDAAGLLMKQREEISQLKKQLEVLKGGEGD